MINVRRVPISAIKRIHAELDQFEQQAQEEIKHDGSHALGVLRLDLVEECRRRLMFIRYMVKDAEKHADERHRKDYRTARSRSA
jgi:hypothetical protein